ncbi:hypothetical protein, partial [Streptomyces beijiangensis]
GLHRFTRHRGGRRHEVLVQLHEGLDAALAAAATSTSASSSRASRNAFDPTAVQEGARNAPFQRSAGRIATAAG